MGFSREEQFKERDRRLALLNELMRVNNLEAMVFTATAQSAYQLQVKYLTNYTLLTRRSFVFMKRGEMPVLLLPTVGQKYNAARIGWIPEENTVSNDNLVGTIAEYIDRLPGGAPRVGTVDRAEWNAALYVPLSQTKAEFVDVTLAFANMRASKSDYEMTLIKNASAVALQSFEDLVRLIKPGMTEWELIGGAEGFLRSRGVAETLLLCRSQKPHTFITGATDKPLGPDDVFVYSVELAGVGGYWTQIVRPVFMSRQAHPQAYEVWRVGQEAEAAGVKAFHVGNRICDVSDAIEEVIARHGMKTGVWAGHGMGADLGDGVDLGAPNKMPIVPNMVLTLHPSIQSADDGLLYGNTFVCTGDSAESLTGKYMDSPYLEDLRKVIL
jgi:Xaa-Pro aminopeptidase